MASANVSNPQTWNRYAYVLNNPLSFIDPNGLEGCAANDDCTITVALNVVVDENINNGEGLSEQEQSFVRDQLIANLQQEFGQSNIAFDITFTTGTVSVENGVANVTGTTKGALNVFLGKTIPQSSVFGSGAESAGVNSSGTGLIFIDIDGSGKGVLAHGVAHIFTFDDTIKFSNTFEGAVGRFLTQPLLEASQGLRRLAQTLGVSQTLFREGAKRFEKIVPTQDSIKPSKD